MLSLRLPGVLRDRLSNDVNPILQRPTLVAMATKIETKETKQTPLV